MIFNNYRNTHSTKNKQYHTLVNLYSTAFAHTAFSGAVVTDRAAVRPSRQQAKPARTDFDLCCHTVGYGLPFKWSRGVIQRAYVFE